MDDTTEKSYELFKERVRQQELEKLKNIKLLCKEYKDRKTMNLEDHKETIDNYFNTVSSQDLLNQFLEIGYKIEDIKTDKLLCEIYKDRQAAIIFGEECDLYEAKSKECLDKLESLYPSYFDVNNIKPQQSIDNTLTSTWFNKLDAANDKQLSRFIFLYEGKCYISEFRKGVWSDPVELVFI